jgi:cysteine synthase B
MPSSPENTAEQPGKYFYPDQYNNDANWKAHYDTTAPEIIEQTSGSLTHFVAGLGTSGTFIGTGRRLRKFNPAIKLISFQPATAFHGLEGLKHMDSAIVPGIYDPTLADEDLQVESEDAYVMVRRLAREEGIMAGISSGAALVATLGVARRLDRGVVVTVFPDGAEKYLTEKFWTADA